MVAGECASRNSNRDFIVPDSVVLARAPRLARVEVNTIRNISLGYPCRKNVHALRRGRAPERDMKERTTGEPPSRRFPCALTYARSRMRAHVCALTYALSRMRAHVHRFIVVQEPFPAKHLSTQRIDTHCALDQVGERKSTGRVDRLDGTVCRAVPGGVARRSRVVHVAVFTLEGTASYAGGEAPGRQG